MRHEFESNLAVAIPSESPATVNSSIEVPDGLGRVRDVIVAVRIQHTWTADLVITLIAPNGDRVLLVDRAGGSGDDFTDTLFDDASPTGIDASSPPFSGRFQPKESLARLDGAESGGTWQLEVNDTATADGGVLESWLIGVETDNDLFTNNTVHIIDRGGPNTVVSPIAVTGQGANVVDSLAVTVDLEHTYTSDLRLTLFAPDGTGAVLFDRLGGRGDDLNNTVFDSAADTSISDASPPFNGRFQPQESFGAFAGHFAGGTWVLQIEDTATQDGGRLNGWSIDLHARPAAPPPRSNFNIEVRFLGGLTSSQRSVFTLAAARWSEVILGDLPAVMIDGQEVDDLRIDAKGEIIDGPRGTLGQAGPEFIRRDSSLPITGSMTFDTADLASMESDGSLEDVIIHEMGHVLGLGTLWEEMGLVEGANTSNWRYTGPNAAREFGALMGRDSAPVPVETDGGAGTAGGHWDEETFRTELMTGFVNGASNPLSRVTIACLEDMGYEVNYDVADGYSLPTGESMLTRESRSKRSCRVTFTKPKRI